MGLLVIVVTAALGFLEDRCQNSDCFSKWRRLEKAKRRRRNRRGLLLLAVVVALLLAYAESSWTRAKPEHRRVVGHGQVRFDGHGPEWYAFHNKLLRRRNAALHVQLTHALVKHTELDAPGWLVRAFLCIHRYEGAWDANTGNSYFGGLQMDYGFQRAYGSDFLARYGTADNWPVAAQLAVAVRAYHERGFSPWPNTARSCGLR